VAAYGDAWHFHLYGAEPGHVRATVADIETRVAGARPVGLHMYLPIQFADADPDPADESAKPWRRNTLIGTVDYIVETMQMYRALGVEHFVMRIGDPSRTTEEQAVERFIREVRPRLV
jgi:alkanesulfonate monooxygenase SsuD/methylene tetrahydromethanopterin reductase-like flavin-dependent oxidoreductase (luciferase family)